MISCNLKRLLSYNPLAKPLLCGFHRLLYKFKNKKHIVYKAPCGRILRNMPELHQYLRMTKSPLTVDFFNFEVHIRCLAEYFLDDDIQPLNKDLSAGILKNFDLFKKSVTKYLNFRARGSSNISSKLLR